LRWCIPCAKHQLAEELLTRSTKAWAPEATYSDRDLSKNMLGDVLSAGDAAAMPTIAFVEKFQDEFEAHLDGKPCPYEKSPRLYTHNG